MDKRKFLSFFTNQDNKEISLLYEKIQIADKKEIEVCINKFFIPSIWKTLISISPKLDLNVVTNGYFEEADRRMVIIKNDDLETEFPISVINVINKSKFVSLEHKDYLGSIMSLGIDREKLGDLITTEEGCIFPICKELEKFIIQNLTHAKNCPLQIKVLDDEHKSLKISSSEEKIVIASSLRIDSVVAALCNISRNEACKLLNEGKVLIDYDKIYEKSIMVHDDSVITIRGVGKFKLINISGVTQKERLKLRIKKYL